MGVYFIQAGDGGPIKIGRSSNVLLRLKHLQTASPEPLQLLAWHSAWDHNEERELHARLREDQTGSGNEWFRPTPQVAAAAVECLRDLASTPATLGQHLAVVDELTEGPCECCV